jgi:NitT/TauT family transport system substrate-binding protein
VLRGMAIAAVGAGLGARGSSAHAAPAMVHQLGWIKSIQFGGHFAALEQGYFAAEGVGAEFLAGGPGVEPRTIVASGRATTSDLNATGIVLGRAQNMPLKAFAAVMQRDPGAILSLKAQPITAIKDMVGKTIAVPNSIRPTLSVLFKRAGIAADQVTLVPVGTDPGMLAAKQVDGYYGWATNQGVMLTTRGVDIHVAYMNDLGVPGYANVLFATEETLDKRFDDLVRWLRADVRGWRWHMDHPDETARLMVEKYGPPGMDLAAQTAESRLMKDFVTTGEAAKHGLLWIEPDVFEAAIGFAKESGGLPADSPLKGTDVVTQAVIKAALKS